MTSDMTIESAIRKLIKALIPLEEWQNEFGLMLDLSMKAREALSHTTSLLSELCMLKGGQEAREAREKNR